MVFVACNGWFYNRVEAVALMPLWPANTCLLIEHPKYRVSDLEARDQGTAAAAAAVVVLPDLSYITDCRSAKGLGIPDALTPSRPAKHLYQSCPVFAPTSVVPFLRYPAL